MIFISTLIGMEWIIQDNAVKPLQLIIRRVVQSISQPWVCSTLEK